MTNLIAKGREYGYTADQVRKIIKEQKMLIARENLMKEVLACNNIEDMKIVILDWIDKGFICG